MEDLSDLSYFSLFVTNDSCTVIDLLGSSSLGATLGFDSNGKYVIATELLEDPQTDNSHTGRQLSVGDVLLSINEHMTLNDEVSDIILFLETLKECGLQRKLKFLDPSKVAEATHTRARNQNKDLMGFSRDLDYLLGEKVYNNANLNLTAQRDLEWVAYLKHIGGADNLKPAGNFEPSSELKYMVRRGIPAAFRSLIWQKVSLSSIHRLRYPANYYEDLKLRSQNLNRKVADDIEKDVKRTFPEHEYFDRGIGGDSLRFVLKAYALHNPSVGYCQSLNFITGMMLLFLQEDDAFWLLLTVVDTLLPMDCYSKSMIGTHVDQLVFSQIIENSMPKLQKALVETQMQLSLVTVPWFMCLFVNTLRPEVTLRVWDMFFCEGSKVLFRISAALLKKNESALIAASSRDCTELFLEMKNIGRNELDADALIAMAYKSYIPPSLKVKQRRLFTSRSASQLNNMSGKGRTDPPLRKFSGHSGVPSDLIGMGVAHTGPVARLHIPESVAIALSPSSESNDTEPPQLYPMTECLSEKENIGVINAMWSVDSSSSSIGKDDILMSSSPLSTSCLSIFRNSSAATAKIEGGRREGKDKDGYDAECCFDKSHAAAIMQLGSTSFSGTSGEGRAAGTSISVSPSSITDINRTDSLTLPQDGQSHQSTHPRTTSLPASSAMSHATVSQKKKKTSQNSTSLFNMLMYARQPSATTGENSDEYRNFKRADIERLRADIRPALEERFLAFEKNRVARIRTDAESM